MIKRRILLLLVLVFAVSLPLGAQAAQDCDANAVIWCGAATPAELSKAVTDGDGHNTASDILNIYAATGVNASLVNSTVEGTVTKNGYVKLSDNRIVATEAQSVGRQFMEGSTQRGTVWVRPTSVSFASDSLSAFVYMQNNQFMWAIIKSCGNPVIAKPVIAVTAGATATKTVTPTPSPTPVTPQAAPSPPPAVPVDVRQPATIPKTGSGTLLGGIAAPAMWLGLLSYRKSRKAFKQASLKA